jgi:opacity protein-like surface antigen
MKKTLSSIIIVISLFSSQAYAKTEGNYIGIDLLESTVKINSNSILARDNIGSASPFYKFNKKESAYGLGVNYKYAFNFNNFFIAPSLSYDFLNNNIKMKYNGFSNTLYSQNLKLKYRLTTQANLGYDINNQFAIYIPTGVSFFNYEFNTSDTYFGGNKHNIKTSGYKTATFIGFGFSYQPIKNWVVNLEYNKYQNFKITSQNATLNGGQIVAKINLDLMKLGISYRF